MFAESSIQSLPTSAHQDLLDFTNPENCSGNVFLYFLILMLFVLLGCAQLIAAHQEQRENTKKEFNKVYDVVDSLVNENRSLVNENRSLKDRVATLEHRFDSLDFKERLDKYLTIIQDLNSELKIEADQDNADIRMYLQALREWRNTKFHIIYFGDTEQEKKYKLLKLLDVLRTIPKDIRELIEHKMKRIELIDRIISFASNAITAKGPCTLDSKSKLQIDEELSDLNSIF